MMTYLQLFLTFFKIGSLSIGGAYSFLPLIDKEVVQNHAWLSHEEFLEVLGMVQIFPGAISTAVLRQAWIDSLRSPRRRKITTYPYAAMSPVSLAAPSRAM